MTPKNSTYPRTAVVSNHIGLKAGLDMPAFPPCPSKKSGATPICQMGATACSTQSLERVFVPKIAMFTLSITWIPEKKITHALATALSFL